MDIQLADQATQDREAIDRAVRKVNTCMPGVVQSFDPATQTATVTPAVKMRTAIDGEEGFLEYPPIVQAPLVFPFASTAGFALTIPVKAGDPCLIIFSQRGIDNWHEKGGIQPPEEGIGGRHHDLSDAFIILAPSPLTGVLGGWQTDGIEIRNRQRDVYVKLRDADICLSNQGFNCTLGADGKFTVSNDVIASSVSLVHHTHSGVTPGSGSTGAPNR